MPDVAFDVVNRGFSRQAFHYDSADQANVILQDLRKQVYTHVERFLKPGSRILEINAGTGIDALYFASKGHHVHATDLSDGMIAQIKRKAAFPEAQGRLTYQQLSFEALDQTTETGFDYVFSNFGGLNCTDDLRKVTGHLPPLLKNDARLTWVIMPPVCPVELLGIFKGRWKDAFRRLHPDGAIAHVEGEYFKTYYYSVSNVRKALGKNFHLLKAEGLAALSPQPHSHALPQKHPRFYKGLRKIDSVVRTIYPFNRWADHIIVTFQFSTDKS